MITESRGLHSDDFRIAGEFGREIDDGDEDEQRTEHIHIIRDERQVIIEDDLAERYLMLEEIIHLLRQIKDDGNRQNEHDRKEERAQEFLDNIPI